MYFWRVLVVMINPKNLGLLIYILASMGLSFGIGFGATGLFTGSFVIDNSASPMDIKIFVGIMMLAANLLLSIILASSIGEFYYRLLSFSRHLVRYNPNKQNYPEYENLYKIFKRVHESAREKSKLVPKNIRLYICQNGDSNACVIGVRTMIVYDGLLNLSDKQIEGIFAHEFGHIANSDAVLPICKISANAILSISVGIIVAILKLGVIIDFFTSESDKGAVRVIGFIAKWVFAVIFSWILKAVLSLWFLIGFLIEQIASKSREYAADKFAFKIGYGQGLADALHAIDGSIKRKTNIFDGMTMSHPYTMNRIDKLNTLLADSGLSAEYKPEPII